MKYVWWGWIGGEREKHNISDPVQQNKSAKARGDVRDRLGTA